jgi:hypothetical protein
MHVVSGSWCESFKWRTINVRAIGKNVRRSPSLNAFNAPSSIRSSKFTSKGSLVLLVVGSVLARLDREVRLS